MQRWTSQPLALMRDPSAPWAAADLVVDGVQHDGPSFGVLVFFDDPDVAEDVDTAATPSFAGRFTVLGHGNCWGDDGHCAAGAEPVSAFDRRPAHPLTPFSLTLDVTAALRRVGRDRVTVTMLAASVDPDVTEPLRFRSLGLATYD